MQCNVWYCNIKQCVAMRFKEENIMKNFTVRLSDKEQEMLRKLVEYENEHSIGKVTAADILRDALRESYRYTFKELED